MPNDADKGLSWHLGSVSTSLPAGRPWTLNIDGPVSDAEYASHRSSVEFLTETLSESSFGALQRSYNEFKDAADRVAEAFKTKQPTPQMIQAISTNIDNVLTALRRFADRTAHALSQRFGKDSQEYLAFTHALSHEFDNMFPYRFAWHLRDYSDHRKAVPFQLKQESRLSASGAVERAFRLVVDSRTILPDHEWHSLVRADLKQINGEFSIEMVLDGLMLSCRRAYCKTLLAQEPSITAAMENIRAFAGRANPPNGFAPVFIQAAEGIGISPVTVSPVSNELADVAQTALQQARVIAA
jgi:hypothetical protein